MKTISLKEFRSLTKISDSALLSLMESNSLPLEYDLENGLRVNCENIEVKDLVSAIAKQQIEKDTQERQLLTEQASKIIRENLEQIFEEALKRSQQ